ncbi:hypothetical protein CURTO8I2_100003 [Curtobacterium sp. 8I-2]|nr:hypothetical protein CURTO8I2_100003 [Curtobacterium sp. 8I-2]
MATAARLDRPPVRRRRGRPDRRPFDGCRPQRRRRHPGAGPDRRTRLTRRRRHRSFTVPSRADG